MKKSLLVLGVCLISFSISGCNGKGTSQALFTVGGAVSGLNGTLVLQNNDGDDLTVTANGPFIFRTAVAPGSSYAVTVSTNPVGQTCTVSEGEGKVLILNVSNVAVQCYARGGLDPTFNAPDGFSAQVNTAGGIGDDAGNAITIDSEGRILVVGSSTNSAGNKDMVIWRFKADGTLDTTFRAGTGSIVYNNVAGGAGDDSGNAIVVDSLDRILVTGSTTSAGTKDMVVWRFKADGTLDAAFGKNGIISAPVGTGGESGNAIAVDSQGRIVVAGSSVNSLGNKDLVVWRFNANGTTDTEFSADGIALNNNAAGGNGDDSGNAVAVDSQDRILVAGSSKNSSGNMNMVVWRFKTDGTLDGTFGGSGIASYNGAAGVSGNDYGKGIVVDNSGRIVVTGSTTNSRSNTDMVLWRLKNDGTPDSGFGGDGIVVNNGAAGFDGNDCGNAVAVDSENRIVVAGSSTNNAGNTDMVVWRFNGIGTIDVTFGANGVLTHDSAAGGSGADSGSAVAIDSQNRILVAGTSVNSSGNSDMVIWRVFP